MRPYEFGDVNKLAGVGFFLSLIGAEVMGLLLYFGQKNYGSFKFALPYLIIVPLIQLTGLVSSLKSIPYVEEWGDKDYAQGGLFLNILFLSLYIASLIHFFGWVWIPNWSLILAGFILYSNWCSIINNRGYSNAFNLVSINTT